MCGASSWREDRVGPGPGNRVGGAGRARRRLQAARRLTRGRGLTRGRAAAHRFDRSSMEVRRRLRAAPPRAPLRGPSPAGRSRAEAPLSEPAKPALRALAGVEMGAAPNDRARAPADRGAPSSLITLHARGPEEGGTRGRGHKSSRVGGGAETQEGSGLIFSPAGPAAHFDRGVAGVGGARRHEANVGCTSLAQEEVEGRSWGPEMREAPVPPSRLGNSAGEISTSSTSVSRASRGKQDGQAADSNQCAADGEQRRRVTGVSRATDAGLGSAPVTCGYAH